jgi:hypothetical protein
MSAMSSSVEQTQRKRAHLAVSIAGVFYLGIALSHFIVPWLFQWHTTLPASAVAVVAGAPIDNIAFLYLFNADLLLYELMLSGLSFYAARQLRDGKRNGLVLAGCLAVFFLLRTPLEFVYFPFTWPNIAQSVGSFALACAYGTALLWRSAFQVP